MKIGRGQPRGGAADAPPWFSGGWPAQDHALPAGPQRRERGPGRPHAGPGRVRRLADRQQEDATGHGQGRRRVHPLRRLAGQGRGVAGLADYAGMVLGRNHDQLSKASPAIDEVLNAKRLHRGAGTRHPRRTSASPQFRLLALHRFAGRRRQGVWDAGGRKVPPRYNRRSMGTPGAPCRRASYAAWVRGGSASRASTLRSRPTTRRWPPWTTWGPPPGKRRTGGIQRFQGPPAGLYNAPVAFSPDGKLTPSAPRTRRFASSTPRRDVSATSSAAWPPIWISWRSALVAVARNDATNSEGLVCWRSNPLPHQRPCHAWPETPPVDHRRHRSADPTGRRSRPALGLVPGPTRPHRAGRCCGRADPRHRCPNGM